MRSPLSKIRPNEVIGSIKCGYYASQPAAKCGQNDQIAAFRGDPDFGEAFFLMPILDFQLNGISVEYGFNLFH